MSGTFIDKAGREAKAGDYVAFPTQRGHSTWLRFGKVKSVSKSADHDGREKWSIVVWGVDDDWHAGLRKQQPATHKFPDRMVVINEIIPESYKEILS